MAGKSHKTQYYVWYLGWKECRGLSGREFTEPIVRELLLRRHSEELPKLTVEVTRKELKIVQLVEGKRGKVDKVKYPAIPSRDITYATQAMYPDEDVVACIYMGYNARTQCAVHTHVYRCDSPDTAALLVENIKQLVRLPEHQKRIRKIEQELFEKGQIVLRPPKRYPSDRGEPNGDFGGRAPPFARQNSGGSSSRNSDELSSRQGGSELGRSDSYRSQEDTGSRYRGGSGSTIESDSYSPRSPQSPQAPLSPAAAERMPPVFDDAKGEAEAEAEFLSLADELKARLGSKSDAPLLLPPKDYDTIHRKRGNLLKVENRKCLNKEIVGKSGMYKITSNDSARGDSDGSSQKNSNEDEDDTLILGLTNQPTPRSPMYNPPSPMNEPVVYTSDKRVPFSPGPNTADLKKHSYFPSKEDLPGYLPGSRNSLQRQHSGSRPGSSNPAEKRHLRKQQSSPEFRNLPEYRGRAYDEGYTSMGRGDYPPGYFDGDPYPPPLNAPLSSRGPYSPPLSPLGSDVDLSQTVPPRTNHRRDRGSRERTGGPRDKMYRDENDPGAHVPIDYHTAKKRNAMLKRTNSGYY